MIHSRCSPGTVQTTVPANAWVEYDFTTLLNSGDADYTFVLIAQSTDGMDTHSRENTNKPTKHSWGGRRLAGTSSRERCRAGPARPA
jgi:hypothetical protein